jgi:hypothetical protein
VRRNSLLVGAALAAALSAGCRRAPPPVETGVAPGVELAPPTPSSTTLASPLGPVAPGYTNEMQAQSFRDQAVKMGISKLSPPVRRGETEEEEGRAPATLDEGLARTEELTRDLAAQRRALDRGKDKTVALPTETPGILPGRKEGGPIEAAPDAPTPKDPEIN